MNFADPQTLISTIGWSLIHFLWQGSLITLLYWVITRSIQSIHAKYWTGMSLVLLSLIIPILNSYNTSYSSNSPSKLELTAHSVQSYQQLNLESLVLYLIDISLPYFVLIWGLTVLFLSFRLIKSWLSLASIKHECDPHISSQLKQYVKNISIKLDLTTIPLLKVSQQVMVPAAYGVLKPTILLPLSLISQIPANQLEAIIKHELCHLKRNDFIHNIIQLCADILLFFHPGIRWMNNDIRHVREQCCDQMVLSHQTEAITYAKALTNIATFTNGLKFKHSVHLGINDGVLLNRVKFLLQNKSSQSSLMIFMPIIMLIALTTFLLQPQLRDNESQVIAKVNTSIKTANSDQGKQWRFNRRNMGQNSFYPAVTTNRSNKSKNDQQANTQKPERLYEPTKLNRQSTNYTTSDLTLQLQETLDQNRTFETDIKFTETNQMIIPATELTAELQLLEFEPTPTSNQQLTSATQTIENSLKLESFSNEKTIAPIFKKYLAPTYPQRFWFNQIEQDVIATFRIKPNGKIIDINLTSQKNKYVAFEHEVLKAIRKWKFDPESLNHSTLQRTYQQMFSFTISDEVEKNCNLTHTGSRLKRAMPCNK